MFIRDIRGVFKNYFLIFNECKVGLLFYIRHTPQTNRDNFKKICKKRQVELSSAN